jgi:hypothetical protein
VVKCIDVLDYAKEEIVMKHGVDVLDAILFRKTIKRAEATDIGYRIYFTDKTRLHFYNTTDEVTYWDFEGLNGKVVLANNEP